MQDIEALLQLFNRFDTNGDGLINEQEFGILLQTLGETPSDEVLSLDFAAMDANDDGRVDFEEFKLWWLG